MSILTDKLQNVYIQLNYLLLRFAQINAIDFYSVPSQIEKLVFGENKLNSLFNKSIKNVTEEEFDGATAIVVRTFQNCTSLEGVTIPDSVTTIGEYAFSNCSKLTDIYLKPTTPPSLGNTSAIPHTTIHVPVGSGDAYKSATNWSYHSSRIVEDIEI